MVTVEAQKAPISLLSTPVELRAELEDWYAHYLRLIDAKEAKAWVDKFMPNGVFAVGTRESIERTGLWWFHDRGTTMLKERAAYTNGYFWHVPTTILHTVTNITAEQSKDGAITVHAAFAIYSADRGDESQLHVVGRYQDILVRHNRELRFAEHRVIIYGETVPGNMGILM